MLIIRGAFWLGVAVMLLPTEERNQAKLMSTVVATTERVLTFCDRNAMLCQKSAEYGAIFLKKAEFGGRMLMDIATERARINAEPQQAATQREGAPKPARLEPTVAPASPASPNVAPASVSPLKVKTETISKPVRSATAADSIDTLLREENAARLGT